MLPPRSRLQRSADIGRVRQHGRRCAHPMAVLFVARQVDGEAADSRFAFAVGRHIGVAVRRNRVRRRLREIVRLNIDQLEPGYDCLFVIRPGAVKADHEALEQAVLQLLSRGGVLKREDTKSVPEGSQP